MSVSLALIPVALTLRLVMGKNSYDKWVRSLEVREPTDFKSEMELVRTLRKAGYDAERYGGSIKTHFSDSDQFFFWEYIDEQWTAVFLKSDSRSSIKNLMLRMNQTAGGEIFSDAQIDSYQSETDEMDATPMIFPTNFRDRELLFRTLKEFGVNPVREGDTLKCKVEDSLLVFRQSQEGAPLSVEIHNTPDLGKVYQYLSDVDEDYKRCLQSMIYERLKQRVTEKNMLIEHEEVLEDNSIVITINIGS